MVTINSRGASAAPGRIVHFMRRIDRQPCRQDFGRNIGQSAAFSTNPQPLLIDPIFIKELKILEGI